MLKGKAKTQDESTAVNNGNEQPGQFRDNPKVNARIDEYIKNNPKHWDYIQAMPRERLERALVLSEVNKLDRQQKMKDGILRKLEQNPELKQAYETLVKNLPEDQREKVMVSIASRTMRSITPRQTQSVAGARV
ncbi:MAG TPA: hypothetical protein VMP11_13175 [Verrucomicrobiae bacterium]|nr:hypothetical protein [Verrucomicrobiae bacterium]